MCQIANIFKVQLLAQVSFGQFFVQVIHSKNFWSPKPYAFKSNSSSQSATSSRLFDKLQGQFSVITARSVAGIMVEARDTPYNVHISECFVFLKTYQTGCKYHPLVIKISTSGRKNGG